MLNVCVCLTYCCDTAIFLTLDYVCFSDSNLILMVDGISTAYQYKDHWMAG